MKFEKIKNKRVNFRFSEEDFNKLNELKNHLNCTKSEIVRKLINCLYDKELGDK